MDYKYGNKNNWRRWLWNRIDERTPDPRKATVLYLAGEADLDRKIALEHGFRDENLIAIEKDSQTLRKLRDKGTLAIQGEFADIVFAWPHDRKVDVVIGDLCCGLELKVVHLAKLWCQPAFVNATFAFNFLRGRDPSTNELRVMLKDVLSETLQDKLKLLKTEKHRGLQFLQLVLAFHATGYAGLSFEEAKEISDKLSLTLWMDFKSYKSAVNQVFDSIIFRSPFCGYEIDPDAYKNDPSYQDLGKGTAERRRIAAILAHQTMRSTDGFARA